MGKLTDYVVYGVAGVVSLGSGFAQGYCREQGIEIPGPLDNGITYAVPCIAALACGINNIRDEPKGTLSRNMMAWQGDEPIVDDFVNGAVKGAAGSALLRIVGEGLGFLTSRLIRNI